jgi:hypothetical protein
VLLKKYREIESQMLNEDAQKAYLDVEINQIKKDSPEAGCFLSLN